jgi:hypothetical protein
MKRIAIKFSLSLFILSATAFAQNVSTGISIADGQLKNFYLSIGNFYRVPESQVVSFRNRYPIHDEELPVVFFLAERAHKDPQAIIDLRTRRRMSWLDITLHFGLTPEIYYVPLTRVGPPYGNAYGHYKQHKNDYKRVKLVDDEVVNLVNLRFMSDYHHVAPETIMDSRGRGENFFIINNKFHASNQKKENYEDRDGRHEDREGKGNNKKDKNRGRGKGNHGD